MNQQVTKGIVLSRIDYGEADRILTVLSPNNGKLRLMAKGVRRIKSKLAGGVELFSVSDITYITGRNEIGTLISSRLVEHYGNIVQSIERVQLGYDLIKMINRVTEDSPEAAYFDILSQSFAALNNDEVDVKLIGCWFKAQTLKHNGHSPNLYTDSTGGKLKQGSKYNFDYDSMSFVEYGSGSFSANEIKMARLLFGNSNPVSLNKVATSDKVLDRVSTLIELATKSHLTY